MPLREADFLVDIWTLIAGKRFYPYKGERGDKKGLFSVNFTSDTNNFQGMTEAELRDAITSGRFKDRGTIRMLPFNAEPGAARNAFAPQFYLGKLIKEF